MKQKKQIADFVKEEPNKMRDVAFPAALTVMMVLPKVLIVIVVLLAVWAACKLVKISKQKKAERETGGIIGVVSEPALGAAPVGEIPEAETGTSDVKLTETEEK